MIGFVYVHLNCGYPAFFLEEKPEPYALLSSIGAVHVDGNPVGYMEPLRCDSCGKPFVPRTKNIRPVNNFEFIGINSRVAMRRIGL